MPTIVETSPKLDREAAAAGLVLLGPARATAYRRYRFSFCGHEQELATSAVRQERFRCQTCLEAKIAQEAAAIGMELLESCHNPAYRRYRFLGCGHEIDAQVTHVRRRNVGCPKCTASKHETEASAVGVELLGPGTNAHTRRYRFTVCGHTQEAHVTAVRDGRIRCRRCLEQRFAEDAAAKHMTLLGPRRLGPVSTISP